MKLFKLGAASLLVMALFSSVALMEGCVSHAPRALVQRVEQVAQAPRAAASDTLRVMTINLAHGRKDSFHQFFLDDHEIQTNLDAIAGVMLREQPHVVACQEADGPSFWSGDFDHVAYLARAGGYGWLVRGEHVGGAGLSYGTAILSRSRLSEPFVHTFSKSEPTPAKGFTVSTVEVGSTAVDVVSVHLDFMNESIRYRQVKELVRELSRRDRPRVVMGDFNTTWRGELTLQYLADKLDLVAHRPGEAGLETFPTFGSRLDWIFASPELEFVDYRVVPDPVSDHLSVVAELRLTGDQ